MNLLRALVEAAFPARCPGCENPAEPVCAACARTLRSPQPSPPPPGVDRWLALYAYDGVARELIARIKYWRTRATVPWLAERMAGLVSLAGEDACADLVTWAPTTTSRRHARGFDHAELLARAIARALGVPVRRTLRRRPGPPQTGQRAAARRAGPRFDVRRGRFAPRVLLVDDVATTGATLAAAAGALRSHGTARVVAVVAARTPEPGGMSPSRQGMARV
jgi:predicted amidophosphoribosyltransferase